MKISKSIHVKRPPQAAFQVFTEQMASWWPLKQGFSFGRERADKIFIEPKIGGRFFERFTDGEEMVVGKVTAYDPPARVAFTWQPPDWGVTEVDVRFFADGDGTRVELEHRGWEKAGAEAQKQFTGYNGGWDFILERYVAA